MVSNLGDSSFLEDDDAIGLAKRANSVRDCDGRASLNKHVQRFLDLAFRLGIDRRRGFVQDQDTRIGKQCSRDRDALPFATG